MPKYNLQANRYFYHSIYYYLNHPYGVKRKVLKMLKPNILMCAGSPTSRISKTAKND